MPDSSFPRLAFGLGREEKIGNVVRGRSRTVAKFDRYLLSQLLTLFGFFSLVLVSVYWVNQAVQLFEQLIADGQSALVFLEFSALTLPNVVRMVLPVAAFTGTLYVTNRLQTESELVVMQATGFSPWRLARPVLYFSLILAGVMLILTNILVPASRSELAARRAEIAENITARFLVEGSFQHPASGLTLYIREISLAGELLDLYLSDARTEGTTTTYTSERAVLVRGESGPKLVMFDGMAQTLKGESRQLSVTRFGNFTYDIGALIAPGQRRRTDLRELSTPELLAPTAALEKSIKKPAAAFRAEGHSRIAQPLTAGTFAIIGFAALLTGSFSRFGVWRQIALAIVMLIVVQAINNSAIAAAEADNSLWPLIYLPALAGAAIASILLWVAARPRRVRRRAPETGAVPA